MDNDTRHHNWTVLMKEYEAHGFITFAFGGVAIVASHDFQLQQGTFSEVQTMAGLSTERPPEPDVWKRLHVKAKASQFYVEVGQPQHNEPPKSYMLICDPAERERCLSIRQREQTESVPQIQVA